MRIIRLAAAIAGATLLLNGDATLAQQAPPRPSQPPAATAMPPPGTIVVVNVVLIANESTAAVALREQAQKQGGAIQAEAQKLRNDHQELVKQRGSLSAEVFGRRDEDIRRKLADLQKRDQALGQTAQQSQRRIEQAIFEATNEVALAQQYPLVLRKDATVVHLNAIEITDEIMKRVNAKLPSVQLAPQ
jgi:Skp family chaperone for outer membrane proteins